MKTPRLVSACATLAAALLVVAGCDTAESAPASERAPAAAAQTEDVRSAERPRDHARSAGPHADHQARQSADGHAGHRDAPAAGDPAEHSIYHLPGSWVDQDGRSLSISDLGGRVQVVAMVYTHCSYACPRILAQMKRIEGEVADEADGRVGFTLVSIDPERDRPARLKDFAEKSRLDPDRWTLLNGSQEDLLGLSVLLGVKYRATGDGEFAHSNVITILDEEGVIVDRVEGLNADLEPAIHSIRQLLRR